jgi:hypothetical protein
MKRKNQDGSFELVMRTAGTIASHRLARARELTAMIRKHLDQIDSTGTADGHALMAYVDELVRACDGVRGQMAVTNQIRRALELRNQPPRT